MTSIFFGWVARPPAGKLRGSGGQSTQTKKMGSVCPLWLSLLELKSHELVLLKLWMIIKMYKPEVFPDHVFSALFFCMLGVSFSEKSVGICKWKLCLERTSNVTSNLPRGLYSVVRSKAFKRASALVSKRMGGKRLDRFG